MSSEEYSIGIDLGTTYSCVGVYRNGKVEIITNDQGNRTMPSYVSFTEEERIVGENAKTLSGSNPANTVYDAKRLIGRKFSDSIVQKDIRHYPFKVINDGEDKPRISVKYLNELKNFYPEEISAMILTKMREIAEMYVGKQIKNAVITVPAYFNDAQRQATNDAGRIAGLNVLRIINEPTAAALAYGLDKHGERCILIFDLGGGTLDVSVLNYEKNIFEVKSTRGDTHLGGEDFDNKLMEYCYQEFAKKNKLKPEHLLELLTNNRSRAKLKKECESAKRTLSSNTQATVCVDSFYNNIDMNVVVTRAKFEGLCEAEFKKCLTPVELALEDAGLTKDKITDVVLVGGSTRIPKIRTLLKDYFDTEPKMDINPDEAVAYGASIQAAVLSGIKDSVTTDIILIDVTPLSLGIETAGGIMTPLIKRNTSIPCSKEEIFSTFTDNQPGVTIKIYEGERTLAKDNNILGTFELMDIPLALRGVPKIRVNFHLDANGILQVTARDETTQKLQQITITNNRSRLTDDVLNKMILDAEKSAEHDKKLRDKINAKNSFETYLHNIRSTTGTVVFRELVGESNYKLVQDTVNECMMWLDSNVTVQNTNITALDIKNKHNETEGIILPIIKAQYNGKT